MTTAQPAPGAGVRKPPREENRDGWASRRRGREAALMSRWPTPAQYAAFVRAEIEKFGAIIRKENLQMDVN